MDSTDPVIEQMQQLTESWEGNDDRRAIFLSCYTMMTRNTLAAIQSGDFEDNAWVSRLLHRFAEYYFDALTAYQRQPGTAPDVWQVAFHASQLPGTHVIQNLILGINAHVNYDLVFALGDVLQPEWGGLSPEQRDGRYRDHCHVNEIIYQTVNSVQDQVVERYSRVMGLVDTLMGPVDEWLTSGLISDWRDEVWENAVQIIETSGETERDALLAAIRQRAIQRAHTILGEGGLAGILGLV
jgi:hypothetical protein